MKTPDPNEKAPRPKHISAEDEARPDMDHPPISGRPTGFDRGTAAAEREARLGGVPGPDDSTAEREKGRSPDEEQPNDGDVEDETGRAGPT